jgi:hypothetical protein
MLGNNPFDDKFEKRVNWLLDHFNVPGLSIAVVTGNQTFLRVNKPVLMYISAYRRR